MENLEFLSTVNVNDFKAAQGVVDLEIFKNEKTGKCFFSYGANTGAVTSKFPKEKLHTPVVSKVRSEETGETFFLLHNQGEGATKMVTL